MALVSKLKFNIEQQEIDGKQGQKREKKEEIEGIKEGEWEIKKGENKKHYVLDKKHAFSVQGTLVATKEQ